MQNNNQQQIVGAILIAGILIAGAILIKGSKSPRENTPIENNSENTAWQGRPVTSEDHIIGSANAEVIVVEYSDLECPFCKIFHATMQKVVENTNGGVAWAYRHYPIPQLHEKAFREAEATECAFEQGGNNAFWKYTERIFEITPSNDGLAEEELENIANYVGLDIAQFTNCLNSGKYSKKVQADIDDGNKVGVRGTPSSFILVNRKVADIIPGALPYEAVMQKINSVLR